VPQACGVIDRCEWNSSSAISIDPLSAGPPPTPRDFIMMLWHVRAHSWSSCVDFHRAGYCGVGVGRLVSGNGSSVPPARRDQGDGAPNPVL
jgi:hypothetical protein